MTGLSETNDAFNGAVSLPYTFFVGVPGFDMQAKVTPQAPYKKRCRKDLILCVQLEHSACLNSLVSQAKGANLIMRMIDLSPIFVEFREVSQDFLYFSIAHD